MAETIEQVFWFAVTVWVWIAGAIMATGPLVVLGLIRRHNETKQGIGRRAVDPTPPAEGR